MASTTSFAAIIIGLLTTYCYRVPSVLAIPDRKGEYFTFFYSCPLHVFLILKIRVVYTSAVRRVEGVTSRHV
jgi:hypothetical protein